MKKSMSVLILLALTVGVANGAFTYQPNSPNLDNLPHASYFGWQIEAGLPDPTKITGAVLSIDKLYNWTANGEDGQTNTLFITLMSKSDISSEWTFVPDSTVYRGSDPHSIKVGGNDAPGTFLTSYHDTDGKETKVDFSYTLTDSELSQLTSYIANDGVFGIGFDPDCHFFNTDIKLTLTTATVPAPGAIVLGTIGVSLVGWLRRRRTL